jgi:AcrR family transcriptional regulator
MARRSDHSKEEIREMALTAAEKIADRDGFAGLSARKVAKEIGYTVGTLYLVFANLDDLILNVNARTLDKLYIYLQEASEKCRQPNTCVIAIARAYVEFATEKPHRWNMIFDHSLPEGEEIPAWYMRKVAAIFELVEEHLQPMLQGQSHRKLAQTARTLWCGVHGICALAVKDKLDVTDVESVQHLTDTLVKHFLAGLMLEVEGARS